MGNYMNNRVLGNTFNGRIEVSLVFKQVVSLLLEEGIISKAKTRGFKFLRPGLGAWIGVEVVVPLHGKDIKCLIASPVGEGDLGCSIFFESKKPMHKPIVVCFFQMIFAKADPSFIDPESGDMIAPMLDV